LAYKILLLLIIATAAYSADSTTVKRKYKNTDTVGVVGDVVIFYGDYRDILKQVIRSSQSDSVVTDSAFTKYVDIAWEKIVFDILVEEEITKRRLGMSEEEVIRRILRNPPEEIRVEFLKNGRFDSTSCGKYLRNPNPDLARTNFVEYHRAQYENERLIRAITPKAKTPTDRENALKQWFSKKMLKTKIIDRRTAFGFY
jgi:hypothetical protein